MYSSSEHAYMSGSGHYYLQVGLGLPELEGGKDLSAGKWGPKFEWGANIY